MPSTKNFVSTNKNILESNKLYSNIFIYLNVINLFSAGKKMKAEHSSDEYQNLYAQRYAYSILLPVTEVTANNGYYVEQ